MELAPSDASPGDLVWGKAWRKHCGTFATRIEKFRKRQFTRRRCGGARGRTVDYASRVIQMLTADHRHVERLFAAAEQAGDDRDAFVAAADAVCAALTEHAELEEEFFYPALRATDARDLAIQAEVEHDVAKQLILELGRMDAEEERYRPTLNVLREYV